MSKKQNINVASKKPTLKQLRFLKLFTDSKNKKTFGNKSAAARAAGFSWRGSGQETLSKPVILEALNQLLDKQGLTDLKIAITLAEGIEANYPVVCDKQIFEYKDHPTRLKYAREVRDIRDRVMALNDPDGNELVPVTMYIPKTKNIAEVIDA